MRVFFSMTDWGKVIKGCASAADSSIQAPHNATYTDSPGDLHVCTINFGSAQGDLGNFPISCVIILCRDARRNGHCRDTITFHGELCV